MEEKEQKTPKELITPRELTVLPEELTEEENIIIKIKKF